MDTYVHILDGAFGLRRRLMPGAPGRAQLAVSVDGATCARPVRSPELSFEHLHCSRERQGVGAELDRLGNLVARDRSASVFNQLLGGGVVALLAHYYGVDRL